MGNEAVEQWSTVGEGLVPSRVQVASPRYREELLLERDRGGFRSGRPDDPSEETVSRGHLGYVTLRIILGALQGTASGY